MVCGGAQLPLSALAGACFWLLATGLKLLAKGLLDIEECVGPSCGRTDLHFLPNIVLNIVRSESKT